MSPGTTKDKVVYDSSRSFRDGPATMALLIPDPDRGQVVGWNGSATFLVFEVASWENVDVFTHDALFTMVNDVDRGSTTQGELVAMAVKVIQDRIATPNEDSNG